MANLSRNLSSRANNKRRSDHHEKRIKVGKPTQGDQGAVANSGRTETVLADAPTVDELRRARADYYSKAPEERKRAATAGMVYVSETRSTVARAESTSKAEATDNVRRRKHSHRSDRHHRSRKEHRDDDGEAPIYVYGNPNEEASSAAARASSPPLHSQIGGKTSSDLSRARTHKAGDSRSHRHNGRRRSSEGHLREARPVYASRSSNAPDPDRVPHLRRSKTRSNHYTATVEEVKHPKVTRSSTVRDSAPLQTSRPQLRRSNTTTRAHAPPSTLDSVRPSLPSKRPNSYATPSVANVAENKEAPSGHSKLSPPRTGILGPISILFGRRGSEGPVKRIECLTCLSDDIPITKSAKLSCGHRMCHECLKRIFTMSVSDPQHMPPKCCTQDHIPLQYVDKLFGDAFKIKWNKKYQEYTTKNRIYCPSRGCGEWIRPANIHIDTSGGATGGRKYGKCSRCKTKVCCLCNGKWHTGKTCPKDQETKKFIEIAKKEGWQRCFNCSAMVELKEGCNHMTCRCTAEFCIICAKKWKTCDCPWFNYDAVENDRLNHMNIPQPIPPLPLPHHQHYQPQINNHPPIPNRPPRDYNDELARRRLQELRDEAIARRLQTLGMDDDDDERIVQVGDGPQNHQYMNREYVLAAADLLTGPYANAQAAANRLPPRPQPQPPPPNDRAREERGAHLLHQHTAESNLYNNNTPHRRASERVVPRRQHTDYATEYERHQPLEGRTDRRRSEMAGLVSERGGGRVGNWLEFVEDG